MINLQIRKFRTSLLNTINQESLPIEVKRLVMSEILNALDNKAEETIEQEKQDEIKKKEEEENEQSVQQNILAE